MWLALLLYRSRLWRLIPIRLGRVGGMTLYMAPPTPMVTASVWTEADDSDLICGFNVDRQTGKRTGPLYVPHG